MVILFSGIPGCGKTTIAKLLVKKLRSELGRRATIKLFISDKLRPPVYQKFFKLLVENLGKYDFLIFDATFYKKVWRDKLKSLAAPEKVLTVYVYCSLQTAIKRNRQRHPGIAEGAVHIIYRKMEAPKKPDVFLNSEKLTIPKSAEIVLKLINGKNR